MQEARRAVLELAAAGATLAGWVASKWTPWHAAVVAVALAGWLAWGLRCLARDRGRWRAWGLADPAAGWRSHALATAAGLGACVALGQALGTEPPPVRAASVALYAAWALAQEAAVQGVLVANLLRLGVSRAWLASGVAAAFALGHAPDWQLAALAAAGGLAWTMLYARHRNLWLVALSHAIVGAAALLLVRGVDPMASFAGG